MPDPETPAASADALISQICAGVAQRIADADADAREADNAFAAGKFQAYMDRKYAETEELIQDEYESTEGSTSTGGDGEESG